MNAQLPPPPDSGVRPLRALLVYESMFGNTELVASAVATGLRREGVEVTTFEVNDAPAHDAARQGAEPARAETGLREWIDTMSTTDHGIRLAACFDTRVTKVRRLPKAASTRAAHLLRRHGATLVDRPSGFLVHDTQGPLEPDELARAEDWGARLAEQVKARLSVTTAPEHH
jgi:hypothetical protein